MFDVDDVVFARMEGYPFWPARVIAPKPEHLTNLAMSSIPPTQRLVLFYHDGGKYAAMDTSDLRNFDDPRLQKRTREHNGPYKAELRAAFREAMQEHSTNHLSETNSPPRKQRPTKKTAPDLTSPVTGHSESRQTITPKKPKHSGHLNHRTTSPTDSPLRISRHKTPTPHPMASRTHPDSSPSTHPSQSQYFSSQEHPADMKTRSPQLKPSPSVQLRLRLKRDSPTLQPPSPSTQQPPRQSVPKRRRLVKTGPSNIRSHPPPEDSEKQPHHHRPAQHKPHPSNHKNQTAQPHQSRHKHISEKLTYNANRHASIYDDPHRVPRLTNRNPSHQADEKSQRKPDNSPSPPKSHLVRNKSKRSASEEIVPQTPSEYDSDEVRRSKKRKRSSKVGTGQPENSDIDGEPRRKEMRRASKRSLSAERPRRSHEVLDGAIGDGDVKGDGAEKVVENRTSMESEKKTEPDTGLEGRSSAFDHLTRGECLGLIEHLQETIRQNNVELWRRGIRLAEEKNILTTEEGLIEACSGAVQKAENVFNIMKSEGKEKKGALAKEAEAYEACNALRDVYFDLEKVDLQKLGNRIVVLVREMRLYSIKVSRALMDVVVMWADLTGRSISTESKEGKKKGDETKKRLAPKKDARTVKRSLQRTEEEKTVKRSPQKQEEEKTMKRSPQKQEEEKTVKRSPQKEEDEDGEKESVGKRKVASTEKGSTEKKISTREQRLQKFDRKTFYTTMELLFNANDGKTLKLDEKEILGIAKRLEREIRPRSEDDKLGYYGACLNVIRGMRKVLTQVAASRKGETEEENATLLVDIVNSENREKTKLLVSRLNGRLDKRN